VSNALPSTMKEVPVERGVIVAKPRSLGFLSIVATFAIVLTLGGGPAEAATCNVPSLVPFYPTIQSAVNDPSCNPINVAAGTYPENVTIPIARSSLILNGAQAGNPVAGRTFAVGESTITGTGLSLPDITIHAANVIIDGFSLENLNQSTGILIKTTGDNALITNNIIQGIGGVFFAGNTQAIYLENGPDDVTVVGNKISFVEGVITSNGGVFIGDSTASNPSLRILIEGNTISDIHSGNKGAYAIHVNNGASIAPSAIGFTTVTIRNNAITRLVGGGWTHAIGLEGDTPGVLVVGNDISNLVAPSDAVAVWFEDNRSFGTAKVNQNNFDVTIAVYGIAVHPALIVAFPNSIVDGTCNWWDSADGPGPVGPGTGARVTPNVDYTPWLIAPAPAGACVGGVSAPAKVTGGGQIPGDDPVFSLLGDLLSVPALIPSLADPNAKATFGFVVKCCPATGNLEYNDHQADVRIKAQSVEGPVIRSPGDSCPTIPGSKHATIGGTAKVIRSTGTTMEDFTVEVDDCGEPGTADTFGIKTDSYSNGWPFPSTLTGGNIQIHK
jgi:hypothetical protein